MTSLSILILTFSLTDFNLAPVTISLNSNFNLGFNFKFNDL